MANGDMDRVVPLGQLDDFRVAEGDPDGRGWEVLASDGRKIGEVDELLVDTAAMKVRYLDVDLDVDDVVLSGGHDRHVLIPIGYARLERDRDRARKATAEFLKDPYRHAKPLLARGDVLVDQAEVVPVGVHQLLVSPDGGDAEAAVNTVRMRPSRDAIRRRPMLSASTTSPD